MCFLVLLLACRDDEDCPTFDETVVTNPDGEASAKAMDEARAALTEFAAWSGRAGVCVSEIRMEPAVVQANGDTAGGLYHREGWIEVEYSYSVTSRVRHELCHALDHQDGWASESRPDLFSSDRPHEDFAYLCDDGPRDLTLALGLDATCDADHAEVLRYVNGLAYPRADVVTVAPTGALPLSVERQVVTGLPDHWEGGPAMADGAIWGLGGNGSAWSGLVVRVDPATGAATTWAVPEGVERSVLVAAEDGPLVLISVGAPYGAWRFDTVTQTWASVPFPEMKEVTEAIALGDDVWLTGQRIESVEDVLIRVDRTGAVEVRALPGDVVGVQRDGDVLLASAHDDDGWFWLRYDAAADTWSREENPDGWRPFSRLTLPDGLELVTWESYVVDQYDVAGLGVRNPATGEFWTADAPCDEDLIGLSNEVLVVDGQPWVWESANSWLEGDYVGQYTLTRIDLSSL